MGWPLTSARRGGATARGWWRAATASPAQRWWRTAEDPANSQGFWDAWVETERRLGLLPPGFDGDVYLALHRSGASLATTPERLLDAAIIKVGAAGVAGPLLHHLRQHPDGLPRALTPIPHLLEVVALTLSAAGVLGALDLCADALYRVSGGRPKANGELHDLGRWRKPERRAQDLKRFPASQQWLERLLDTPEPARIEAARDALIHRHLARRQQVSALVGVPDGLGGYRLEDRHGEATVVVPQGPDLPEKVLGRLDDLVAEALAFGEREVLACREALRKDGAISS